MTKLHTNKGKVHPSPPHAADRLSLLPATILALTVALPPEDKEVLAYLISCSNNNFPGHRAAAVGGVDHPPKPRCDCFRCYMSYWVRWDTSPNRELIHEVLEAYEDGLVDQKKKVRSKKERRKRVDSGESEAVEVRQSGGVEVSGEVGLEGSVRKVVRFIGEKIWGVWGI